MKTHLTKIGNSKGIILPAPVIKECGLDGEVELTVQDQSVIITPVHTPREGWAEASKALARASDDSLRIPDSVRNVFDDSDEWSWE